MTGNGGAPPTTGIVVLGGSGYVAGELLRWIAGHPYMELAGAVSTSRGGAAIADVFPNLAAAFPEQAFASSDDLTGLLSRSKDKWPRLAAFSAAPHKTSALAVVALLEAAAEVGCELPVVDLSADFRHPDPDRYEAIYGIPHPAPELLAEFHCGIPELDSENGVNPPTGSPPGRVAHPGCFATAVALAAAPLIGACHAEGDLHASAITGSTGSGGVPKDTTHHPLRHANLFAYKPLSHRHVPEMEDLLERVGEGEVRVRFVPHSGPFARGIHATVFAAGGRDSSTDEKLDELYRDYYRDAPLVRVSPAPRLKETVGSAGAVVGATTDGETVVAFAALDNLGKGAASGGIQWMNRLLGLPDETGLTTPTPGWL